VPHGFGAGSQTSCLQLIPAEIELARSRVNELYKFIIRSVAYAITIRVTRQPIRRIGKQFINHEVAQSVATKRHRDWVAHHAIRRYDKRANPRSTQLRRRQHMNLIQTAQPTTRNRFNSQRLPVDHN
jgi:hypothetical protein